MKNWLIRVWENIGDPLFWYGWLTGMVTATTISVTWLYVDLFT